MRTLLETIQLALASEATDEARGAGAAACRTILTALEPNTGEPMPCVTEPAATSSAPAPTTAATIAPHQIAEIVGALRGLPAEQLLDLAIARLRAALAAGAATPAVAPIRFQLIPVSPLSAVRAKAGGA